MNGGPSDGRKDIRRLLDVYDRDRDSAVERLPAHCRADGPRLLDAAGERDADLAAEVVAYTFGLHRFQPVVRGESVFAWLPGFRDPRASVPDDVYDITDLVAVRGGADEAH